MLVDVLQWRDDEVVRQLHAGGVDRAEPFGTSAGLLPVESPASATPILTCMLADVLEREFGASWRRGPALGPTAVKAFEQEHGVVLPEPYRTFVMSIANGAAGPPDFGLVPLGHPSDNSDAPHSVTPGSLRHPFPLTEVWIWESDPDADDERVSAVHSDGFVPLGTDGDGMDYVLVVTGVARGQVWMVTGEGALPVAADFGRWLEGDVLPDGQFTLETRRRRTGEP